MAHLYQQPFFGVSMPYQHCSLLHQASITYAYTLFDAVASYQECKYHSTPAAHLGSEQRKVPA
eukprot:3260-Heterococcus_DN1.PRE.2